MLCWLLLSTLLTNSIATTSPPTTLFGGWYLNWLGGPANGTVSELVINNTNYLVLSFVDPATMMFPDIFKKFISQYKDTHLILVSIGGESYSSHWGFLASNATAAQAGQIAATWQQYGIDGIDIDAEGEALNYAGEAMATFASAVKANAPEFLITMCVYGNPEGRDMPNYMINNHLNGNGVKLLDWIHVMAYAGYELDVTYLQSYTNAPKSKWDHPINQAVSNQSVVIGMKGANGFNGNCNPPDYTEMVDYVKSSGLRGIGIWAFVNNGGNISIPWYSPGCDAGYQTLCQGLLNNCGSMPRTLE